MNQIQFNEDRGRLEVSFHGKPPTKVIQSLKQHGFYWDPAKKCWHLANPQNVIIVRGVPVHQDGFKKALEYAAGAAGVSFSKIAEVTAEHEAWQHQQGARGMEMACGIA